MSSHRECQSRTDHSRTDHSRTDQLVSSAAQVCGLRKMLKCPRWGRGPPLKFSIAICLDLHASPHSTSYRCSSLLPVRCDARFAVDGHAFFSLGDSNPRLAWVCVLMQSVASNAV
ncbi:unnamed protein product [Spodoptera exigua]|nr:unnamed protein product [Spodoptera exigua]